MLRLAVVILTYNSDRDLRLCLNGFDPRDAVVDVIVVDNGSSSVSRARMRSDVRAVCLGCGRSGRRRCAL